VTVAATASDNVGVASVQFLLDGAALGAPVTGAPYSVSWNTTAAANGSHSLTAVAGDAAGNTGSATAVMVTVSNSVSGGTPAGIPTGAAGFWSFDAAAMSGSTALDQSGNGDNAACSGISSILGAVNQAAHFNGSSAQCSVQADTGMLLTNDLTLSAWVRTTNSSRYESLLSTYDASANENNYLLRTTPSGTLSLLIGGGNMAGGYRIEALDARKINDGQWHHVAAVMQIGTGVTFYVDGVAGSLVQENILAKLHLFVLQFGITSWTPYGNYLTGDLDQVRIYSRALTAAEVAGLAQE